MKATIGCIAVLSMCAGATADIKASAVPQGQGDVVAGGDVLWDQSDFNADINALVDQEFEEANAAFSSYMVNDVVVGEPGWNISSMTTYFTNQNLGWPDSGEGRLNIFEKTGALPGAGDDPMTGMSVPITITDNGSFLEVTADGLDIDLGAGEYWIGLTPSLSFTDFGQEFHLAAPIEGGDTAWRNPGDGFGNGGDWQDVSAIDTTDEWVGNYDAAMLINGTIIPAPGAMALLGAGGLLVARRRR